MRVVFFVFIAFGTSWSLYYGLTPVVPKDMHLAVLVAYMFGPLIAAAITSATLRRGTMKDALGFRFKLSAWWLLAWIAPPFIAAAALGVAGLMPGVELRSFSEGVSAAVASSGRNLPAEAINRLPGLPVVLALAMIGGVFPNAIAAFGEEAGWRGFLWREIRPLGFWKSSLLVGVIWGVWHAPIVAAGHNYGVDYQGHPWLGVIAMIAFTTLLSPFMGLLRDRTQSAIPAAIFHGTINAVAGVSILMVENGQPLIVGLPGLAGMIVLIGLGFLVALSHPDRDAAKNPVGGRNTV